MGNYLCIMDEEFVFTQVTITDIVAACFGLYSEDTFMLNVKTKCTGMLFSCKGKKRLHHRYFYSWMFYSVLIFFYSAC
jgi:hypothetical protein